MLYKICNFAHRTKQISSMNYTEMAQLELMNAMGEFIFNEAELLRVQETLVKAAFCL